MILQRGVNVPAGKYHSKENHIVHVQKRYMDTLEYTIHVSETQHLIEGMVLMPNICSCTFIWEVYLVFKGTADLCLKDAYYACNVYGTLNTN